MNKFAMQTMGQKIAYWTLSPRFSLTIAMCSERGTFLLALMFIAWLLWYRPWHWNEEEENDLGMMIHLLSAEPYCSRLDCTSVIVSGEIPDWKEWFEGIQSCDDPNFVEAEPTENAFASPDMDADNELDDQRVNETVVSESLVTVAPLRRSVRFLNRTSQPSSTNVQTLPFQGLRRSTRLAALPRVCYAGMA